MAEERRHESADLEDYEVLDSSDTLDHAPGDDPLDRGVVTPQRWSAGMRFGSTAEEQRAGESLDQLLAEEAPDIAAEAGEAGEEPDKEFGWDENATDGDISRFSRETGPDLRAGRLVADDEGAHPDREADLIAHDSGVDGGGASAEEAAVHIVDESWSGGSNQARTGKMTVNDSLDDLAAFLMHRTVDPRVGEDERLRMFALVAAYQDGDDRDLIESAMRTTALKFADHPDYRTEWRPGNQARSNSGPT